MSFIGEEDALWQTLESIVIDEGVRLYDLEALGDQGLRVTIEKPKRDIAEAVTSDAESGAAESGDGVVSADRVTSGDCSKVCRRLMVYFQVEGAGLGFSAEPQIEVCSPGVNRGLRLRRHFNQAVGERIKVTFVPVRGVEPEERKRPPVIGTLDMFENDTLTLNDEMTKSLVTVPLAVVKRASVEFKF